MLEFQATAEQALCLLQSRSLWDTRQATWRVRLAPLLTEPRLVSSGRDAFDRPTLHCRVLQLVSILWFIVAKHASGAHML